MLSHRCELQKPVYDPLGNRVGFEPYGKIWGQIEVAYTSLPPPHASRRDHHPPAKPLYTLMLRTNHVCGRGWRVRFKNKSFSVLSEPIFRDATYHQFFIQTLDEAEL